MEDLILKFLRKKGICRFKDIENFINITLKDKPSKATISKTLDKMEEEGKIISWYEKSKRFVALKEENEKIKEKIKKVIEDYAIFNKRKFTIDDLLEEIHIPREIAINIMNLLVADGYLKNENIDGEIHYSVNKYDISLKVGFISILFFILLLIFGENLNAKLILAIAILVILAITFIWSKSSK